jgi:hypothetical protein
MEWLGQVVRVEDFGLRLPKNISNAKLEKERKIGRNKLRSFDEVQSDIRTLGIKRWIYKPQDGPEWRLRSNLQGP